MPEEKTRFIFEQIFQESFPKFNRLCGTRLQLDGYNEKLALAFEYNGQQHYKYTPVFHKSLQKLAEQKMRDKKKCRLCAKEGIKLIVVPYTKKDNLEKFIRSQLAIPVNSQIDWDLFEGKPDKMKALDDLIMSKQGKRLSATPYENNRTIITVECAFGHKWDTHGDRLTQGHWCYKCSHRHPRLVGVATKPYLSELYENLTISQICELFDKKHQIAISGTGMRNIMRDLGLKMRPRGGDHLVKCRNWKQ